MTPADLLLVRRMRANGIVNPIYTLNAARKSGLPITLACAILSQETGGGHNEWGHDPTIFIGGHDARTGRRYGEIVTKEAYLAYAHERGPYGRGGMQGCGPCQLTYYAYQLAADKLGGCWKPYCNMRVGFGVAAANIRRDGLRAGIAAYNGSGPAATRYAENVLSFERGWATKLKRKSIQ